MTLHLIKLCVGVETLDDLAQWQKRRIADLKKKGKKLELMHVTRQTPKRARQKLLELRSLTREGVPHCGLVYEPKLIPTLRRAHRPFQGWRYFDPKAAPPDVRDLKGGEGLPQALKMELAELGLL